MASLFTQVSGRRSLLFAMMVAGVLALPAGHTRGFSLVPVALADDDGDDGGGRSGGGSDRGGSDASQRGGQTFRGFRPLFRLPWRTHRLAPARRQASIPDRARNEIVATGLDEAALTSLTQSGFIVEERIAIALVGGDMVRLTVPPGMALDAARQAVTARSASASVDFNHFYQPQAQEDPACTQSNCALVRHMVGWPTGQGTVRDACLTPQRIGLVDTAINVDHSVLAGARLEVVRLGNEKESRSGEQHGTAVAALLVGGSQSRVPGLLPSSELVAVDAFRRLRGASDIANVYDLVRAVDLLVGRDIKVINLSLTGPANRVLEQAVEAAIGRGTILVAAAGNEGPNARPVYPAAYEDVIAVTAVDRSKKPYRRAVRGEHIDIAAPGVGVWTAASVSGARQKSGTSFAAPFVTAAVSVLLAERPGLTPREMQTELMRYTDDIGQPGKDTIYGWGLLNARLLCEDGKTLDSGSAVRAP